MQSDYTLAYGTHASPEQGRCAMEWVSYLAGEEHSDQPACVSPVLRAVCIALNDGLEHEPRQRLRPYLARTIGTAGDGLDPARAWMALDWLIRDYTSCWLVAAGLRQPAADCCAAAPVLDEASLQAGLKPLERARAAARRARSATGAGAWSPARSVARECAWSCAGAAAWAVARLAVGDLAGDRARAAARATAGDAAAAAVGLALQGGPERSRSETKVAARDLLSTNLEQLHRSALSLLDRMLPTEPNPVLASDPGALIFTVSV